MKLNLPNKLTVIRLLLIPVFLVFIVIFHDEVWGRILSAAVFAIAAFTDFLDGKIARKNNLVTDFGKFLDPLADKFLVLSALFSMACIIGMGKGSSDRVYGILFFIAAMTVLFRELAVTSMRLVVATSKDKIVIAASWLGKIKTATQIAFVLTAMLEPLFWQGHIASYILMAAMTVMTLWSGLSYIIGYWKYLDPSK